VLLNPVPFHHLGDIVRRTEKRRKWDLVKEQFDATRAMEYRDRIRRNPLRTAGEETAGDNLIMIARCLLFLALATALPAAQSEKLRLLILSGANNHDWKSTTPVLKSMYEASGWFTVDVTEDVPALTGADFVKYDVLVCNYTTYPKIEGHRWPAATEKAFLDYIAAGHGFVLFHAASTAWDDWPEFGDLIGLTWQKNPTTGKNISGHGSQHSFAVTLTDTNHPVTKGMKDFQHVTDELYHRQRLHPGAQVLATTFSSPAKIGSGTNEPMVVVTELGQRRMFHCAMGHHAAAMAGAGFQALMLRGTEWVASGQVTIPGPADLPAPRSPEAVKQQ
jgi:type 1 glutamine amidotransferase